MMQELTQDGSRSCSSIVVILLVESRIEMLSLTTVFLIGFVVVFFLAFCSNRLLGCNSVEDKEEVDDQDKRRI